jgi:hypothetical protein
MGRPINRLPQFERGKVSEGFFQKLSSKSPGDTIGSIQASQSVAMSLRRWPSATGA